MKWPAAWTAACAAPASSGPTGRAGSMEDPDFLRLAEACAPRAAPLNLHVNEEVGPLLRRQGRHPAGGCSTGWPVFFPLTRHHPGALGRRPPLLRDHAGGPAHTAARSGTTRRPRRCSSRRRPSSGRRWPAWTRPSILYGSDYPLRICPLPEAGADFRPFLGELDVLGPAARRPLPASWAAMRPACWARRRPGRTVRIEQGARCPGSRKAPAHGPTPGPLPRGRVARGEPRPPGPRGKAERGPAAPCGLCSAGPARVAPGAGGPGLQAGPGPSRGPGR